VKKGRSCGSKLWRGGHTPCLEFCKESNRLLKTQVHDSSSKWGCCAPRAGANWSERQSARMFAAVKVCSKPTAARARVWMAALPAPRGHGRRPAGREGGAPREARVGPPGGQLQPLRRRPRRRRERRRRRRRLTSPTEPAEVQARRRAPGGSGEGLVGAVGGGRGDRVPSTQL
jgi:hypothetical protein